MDGKMAVIAENVSKIQSQACQIIAYGINLQEF